MADAHKRLLEPDEWVTRIDRGLSFSEPSAVCFSSTPSNGSFDYPRLAYFLARCRAGFASASNFVIRHGSMRARCAARGAWGSVLCDERRASSVRAARDAPFVYARLHGPTMSISTPARIALTISVGGRPYLRWKSMDVTYSCTS